MATVPLSGTNIVLLQGIPFANDYKHTRWFDDEDSQYNYFQSKHLLTVGEANFQRIEGRHFISISSSLDLLWGCNYLMFRNTAYGNKWFYAFVTKLEYVQKNTTYVHFEIDVLQTWRFVMGFRPSFVIREHCDLWNTDGSPVINTVDEGLNYGSEYEIKSQTNFTPHTPIYYLVIACKTAMHKKDGVDYTGKIIPISNGLPQPLTYYIFPFNINGETPLVMIGGYVMSGMGTVLGVLQALCYGDKMAGNIASCYVTEYAPGSHYTSETDIVAFDDEHYEAVTITDPNIETELELVRLYDVYDYDMFGGTVIADKYSGYDAVTESKLLMYPYTVLILDDFRGNRVALKNEFINGNDIVLYIRGSLGHSNKVTYSVDDYLGQSGIVSLENGIVNNSPNDIPILHDYLTAFLQGNRNTIDNQKQTIAFNGVIDTIGSIVGGVASAGVMNIPGLLSSGVGMVKGGGNAVLQLQGIQAKIKDIDNMPPTLVKMGGNTQFDFGNGITGVYIIKKQIRPEYQKKLSDFFKMYGYKLNEVKIPNFHTRQNWNYVQTSACNIIGYFNNEDLDELKQVFDNGITLWHTDDVGNYLLANEVI